MLESLHACLKQGCEGFLGILYRGKKNYDVWLYDGKAYLKADQYLVYEFL